MRSKTEQSIAMYYLDRSLNTVEELRFMIKCIKDRPEDLTPFVIDQLLRGCDIISNSVEDYSHTINSVESYSYNECEESMDNVHQLSVVPKR